jgi:hypothetical protein
MTSDKLKNYLDSKGCNLPYNFSRHRHTRNCVFCDGVVETDFHVFFYPIKDSAKQSVSTGTLACANCAEHIMEMETEMEVSRRNTLVTTDLYARYKMYLAKGEFDETIGMHLIERDIAISPLQYKCYFCKSSHVMMPNKLIHVPVDYDRDNGFTGGMAPVCNGCYNDLVDSEDCIVPLEDIPKIHYVKWTCAQCSSDYYVTKKENEYRHFCKKSDYLCPSCTYIQCTEFNLEIFSISKFAVIERAMTKACDFCLSTFYLDMCRPASALEKDHVTPKKRIMCESCASYSQDGPIESVTINESTVMLIYDVPGRHNRYLFVVKSKLSGKILWEKAYTGKLIDLVVEVMDIQLKSFGIQQTL